MFYQTEQPQGIWPLVLSCHTYRDRCTIVYSLALIPTTSMWYCYQHKRTSCIEGFIWWECLMKPLAFIRYASKLGKINLINPCIFLPFMNKFLFHQFTNPIKCFINYMHHLLTSVSHKNCFLSSKMNKLLLTD